MTASRSAESTMHWARPPWLEEVYLKGGRGEKGTVRWGGGKGEEGMQRKGQRVAHLTTKPSLEMLSMSEAEYFLSSARVALSLSGSSSLMGAGQRMTTWIVAGKEVRGSERESVCVCV